MTAKLLAVHPVLAAHDVAESIAFYRGLGFSPAFQDAASDPTYACIVRDGIELHLQWADAGQWNHPIDRPAIRFAVDDVDLLYGEFVAGGRGASGGDSPWAAPANTPWGTREFHLRDPGLNSLQFFCALSGAM